MTKCLLFDDAQLFAAGEHEGCVHALYVLKETLLRKQINLAALCCAAEVTSASAVLIKLFL